MIKLNEIVNILNKNMDYLKTRYKVKSIGIFGSYVQNNQNINSDLDILVEFYEPVGFGYFYLKDYLEDILNVTVDLVIKNGIKPQLKDKILKQTIYVA